MKNPIVAGLLNFFLPGAGYIYTGGKKRKFGFIILLSFVLLYSTAFLTTDVTPIVNQNSTAQQSSDINLYDQIGSIAAFLMLFGFAYDGYQEALKKK